jgi:plasmid stability protein
MATLHIRNLKDSAKESIRIRAAVHGRSMEAEARAILEQAADKQEPEEHLYLRVRKLVEKYGPMDVEIPPREGLTGAQFVQLMRAAVDNYGPLDIEIPPRGQSHREIPDFS